MNKALKLLIIFLIVLIVLAVVFKCYTIGIIYGVMDAIGIEPISLSAQC